MTTLTRRGMLHGMAAGTATLTLPPFLFACGPKDLAVQAGANGTPGNPFLAWFGIDEGVLRVVMAELTRRGADAADLYFQYARTNSVTLEDGIISRAASRVEQGVGLRVVIGDQVGFAITEDLTQDAMVAAARTAAAIASGTAPATLAPSFTTKGPGHYYEVSVPWSEVGIDRKLPILNRAEALVRAKESAIDKVTVSWSDVDERVLVADLKGNIVTDHRPMHRLWVNTTATKNGVTQANGSNLSGRQGIEYYTEEKLGEVTQQAIDRTMVLFEARRPPSGEMPVVLTAGASGILLHEAIGHGMEADFNRKNTSIYSDMIGKKIAPDFVTIVDDGTIPGERGALNYDDEGNSCERTTLVQNGVLESYLHDDISARHYGVASTGSGRRESFRFPPMPRMRCTYMENGPHSKDEIVKSVQNGIIAETFTNGQVQIGAGDFTFYVKNGWLIEGGKITAPIKDCNIIGNGPDVLRKITMAAADSKLDTGGWTCGKNGQGVPVSQGLPTLLVSSITVGGTDA
jgi:TldD protein